MLKLLKGFLITFCAVFVLLECAVIGYQNKFTAQKSDCVVILGHSLENGQTPGDWLAKRLYKGLELYDSGYADYIVLSGGKGPEDNVPVAESMKWWLLDNGVDESRIIVEDKAGSTYENMILSYDIIKSKNLESVIVVTNDFHIFRAMLIAENTFDEVSGAGAPIAFNIQKIGAYMKEPFSIIKDFTMIKFKNIKEVSE